MKLNFFFFLKKFKKKIRLRNIFNCVLLHQGPLTVGLLYNDFAQYSIPYTQAKFIQKKLLESFDQERLNYKTVTEHARRIFQPIFGPNWQVRQVYNLVNCNGYNFFTGNKTLCQKPPKTAYTRYIVVQRKKRGRPKLYSEFIKKSCRGVQYLLKVHCSPLKQFARGRCMHCVQDPTTKRTLSITILSPHDLNGSK